MTLLDGKPSTIDVDFTVPKEYYDDFLSALKTVPHGFKVEAWPEGQVFSQMLPSDYLAISILIETTLKHIELRALHPLDIVITKIGRLIGRDLGDIEICIRNFGLKADQIRERASKIGYAGNDEVYEMKLNVVIRDFF
ncbi:hypothetical protein [Candidatus Nitrosotalea okcheonensis]|uniref:Uncharacterized protein n=1 Tax=Candidatus Nitrosotalea okcheonensis TaxID=1903276 RepID=A0A2H1FEH9_9ARCH|nr:hypothetical protein [Candidatus Nitrosotalea okcheonensis]MDE1727910.1 hypothetical protein [Nitrososphaerota archaeon]SMH71163.1 conserved protein of unknown function [Candidatus Nitrosotalea okcheonensis]